MVQPGRTGGARAVRVLEAAAVLLVAAGFAFMAERQRALDDELSLQRAAIARAESSADMRLTEAEGASRLALAGAVKTAEAAETLARASTATLRSDLATQEERLVAQSRLLDELGCRNESALDRAREELDVRLRTLAERMDLERDALTNAADRFRAVQRRADRSVFLVHCSFTYESKEDDGWADREASAWGTAFIVTKDGLLVTNKHLVQPWKFDPELAALRAMGDVRIKEDSVKIAAWPVGEPCLDADKKPLFERGFNTDRGDLAFVLAAEDRNVKRAADAYRRAPEFELHALDDRDLALLWVAGGPHEPLPLLSAAEEKTLRKLDPVLALGFPRGNSGLEASVAESSATMGVVRKIENTIQVTAPIIAGNSGGPVLDEHGRVIGVATRIFTETLGICIKAKHVRALIEEAEAARAGSFAAFRTSAK